MARTRSAEHKMRDAQKAGEQVAVLGNQPLEELPNQGMTKAATTVTSNSVIGSAVTPQPPEAPKIKYYRIDSPANIASGGFRHVLKPGKIVDSANFNIERLKTQGVRMTEMSQEEVMIPTVSY